MFNFGKQWLFPQHGIVAKLMLKFAIIMATLTHRGQFCTTQLSMQFQIQLYDTRASLSFWSFIIIQEKLSVFQIVVTIGLIISGKEASLLEKI